ncbi:MAG: transcriptional regulator [Microgenomates group bacterium LiPW_16]|nr:MAG: transcriptional regulator [Microgenomates group bacterium LiPW_16]
MKNGVVLLDIDKLKCHEEVVGNHVEELRGRIRRDGCLKRPIVVTKNSLVILDGHHRFQALKRMGITKIPAQLVDYKNGEVRVYLRRKELLIQLIKEAILKRVEEGKLFPPKTTRHLIKNRAGVINFSLEKLKNGGKI